MARLLDGVRVVSIEQAVAAPLCTRHLAELGASVIKIENPPTGDFARAYDTSVAGSSAHFVWLNGGKRSVAVDLKTPLGMDVLMRLIDNCDVFVCNLAPSARERLIPDSVLAGRPGLIRCYVSGYGIDGPYAENKAYDALIQGETGAVAATGTPTQPVKCGMSVADLGTGTYAFALVNAALVRRTQTGEGCRIDVALFDVMADWLSPLLLAERNGGHAPPPAGARHAQIVPYGAYKTADGRLVNIAVQNDGQWKRFCELVLKRAEILERAGWSTNAQRTSDRANLEPVLEELISQLTDNEFTERLDAADIPWGRVNTLSDAARHPQMEERGRWQRVNVGNGRTAEVLASPFFVDGVAQSLSQIPGIGEHTGEVMKELGFGDENIAALGVVEGHV